MKPLPIRAQHLSLSFGPTDPALARRLVEEAARSGMNTLLLELGRGFRYAAHPELAAPWALPRKEVLAIAAAARAAGLNVIPLVQLLTHVDDITRPHPDFAEPSGPGCPSHPGMAALAGDLLADAADSFQPRAVHIGHDEILSAYDPRRRVPVFTCPRCRGRRQADLLAGQVIRLRDTLAAGGARTWMWADSLLDPDGFREAPFAQSGCYGGPPDRLEEALEAIPRDVMMCDWHYEPSAEYPTIRHLQDRGFGTLGASLFGVNGFLFTRYAHLTRTPRFRGMIATAWRRIGPENARSLLAQIREHGFIFRNPGVVPPGHTRLPAILEACRGRGRPLPRGPFHRVVTFAIDGAGVYQSAGWRDLRYIEYPRSHDPVKGPRYPSALAVKANRAGWIQYAFTASRGGVFDTVRLAAWMACPGGNAIAVRPGGEGPWQPVAVNRPLRGRRLDLTPWLRGCTRFDVRFEADNRTERRCDFLTRFEVSGCTKGER